MALLDIWSDYTVTVGKPRLIGPGIVLRPFLYDKLTPTIHDGVTIGKFWDYLLTLERHDVIEECRPLIVSDCQAFLDTQKKKKEIHARLEDKDPVELVRDVGQGMELLPVLVEPMKLKTATKKTKHELVLTTKTSQLLPNYHLMVSKAKMLIKAGFTVCWMMPVQAVSNYLSVCLQLGTSITCDLLMTIFSLRTAYLKRTKMRSLKDTGCLSRGIGYNEVMQNRWALSEPVTSEYNSAMYDFTELAYTSPQHKDSTEVRI
ncbi:hypothetical protein DPMN_189795 [Dreissena polymorpha]|uniref:Uncharacterized protein n=1 Tax=Dreissena polymorpha TaxID=45954 RepID=A0A9D4IB56_DREPO|nr:hypothetical protein DPMN_189795 [Dreissena polymorpha]